MLHASNMNFLSKLIAQLTVGCNVKHGLSFSVIIVHYESLR